MMLRNGLTTEEGRELPLSGLQPSLIRVIFLGPVTEEELGELQAPGGLSLTGRGVNLSGDEVTKGVITQTQQLAGFKCLLAWLAWSGDNDIDVLKNRLDYAEENQTFTIPGPAASAS